MLHSVTEIATKRCKSSRKFHYDSFIAYAKLNKEKYSIIEDDNDMYVNTKNSKKLITEYVFHIRKENVVKEIEDSVALYISTNFNFTKDTSVEISKSIVNHLNENKRLSLVKRFDI